jgi:probable phosphoglycerate mutase
MIRLALLRHGATEWNRQHRLQGRSDLPLSADGRAQVGGWRLPAEMGAWRWWSSPLQRSRETAEILAAGFSPAPAITADVGLIEMSYGEWEGATLEELRKRDGEQMRSLEARGLDMRPPSGESPRDVQARLRPWLAERAQEGRDSLAIVHKGVIRAVYALAAGWTMERKARDRLSYECLQLFSLAEDGSPSVVTLNLPLDGGKKDTGAAA